jgi:ABC-type transport system involved in multi-copper enzyme maturation permease subunit
MERIDFLHAKALLVLMISIAATLFFILSGLVFGFVNGGGNPFDHFIKVGNVFLYTLNYLSFAAMLAFFIKRSGLTIMLLLAFFLIEMIISGLVNWKFNTYIGNLLPLQCSDELLPLQALKAIGSITGDTRPEAPESLLAICSSLYIVGYYFVVRKKMLTADL